MIGSTSKANGFNTSRAYLQFYAYRNTTMQPLYVPADSYESQWLPLFIIGYLEINGRAGSTVGMRSAMQTTYALTNFSMKSSIL